MVLEVNQPDKATRRRRGKTDAIAAQAVLSGRATATAKTGDGPVEMLRMFKLAKASAIRSRTQAVNQLKAVLVAAEPALREAAERGSEPQRVRVEMHFRSLGAAQTLLAFGGDSARR